MAVNVPGDGVNDAETYRGATIFVCLDRLRLLVV